MNTSLEDCYDYDKYSQNHFKSQEENEIGCRNRKELSRITVGLENLGNTCYMNSAIQCLVHCPSFVKLMTTQDKRIANGRLFGALNALLERMMLLSTEESLYPRRGKLRQELFGVKNILGEANSLFAGYQQRDAATLLKTLLQLLQNEMVIASFPKPTALSVTVTSFDSTEHIDFMGNQLWENFVSRENSEIVRSLFFQRRATKGCICREFEEYNFDSTNMLLLSVPKAEDMSKIYDIENDIDNTRYVTCIIQIFREPYLDTVTLLFTPTTTVNEAIDSIRLKVYGSAVFSGEFIFCFLIKTLCGQFMVWKTLAIYSNQNDEELLNQTIYEMESRNTNRCPWMLLCSLVEASKEELADDPYYDGSKPLQLQFCCDDHSDSITYCPLLNWAPMVFRLTKHFTMQKLQSYLDSLIKFRRGSLDEFAHDLFYFAIANDDYCDKLCDASRIIAAASIEDACRLESIFTTINTAVISSQFIPCLDRTKRTTDNSLTLRNAFTAHSLFRSLQGNKKCKKCSNIGNFEIRYEMWKPPKLLVICLKRMEFDLRGNPCRKIADVCDFPPNDLDLAMYFGRKPNSWGLYDLYGAVEHSGGCSGGHFIAHCRIDANNSWYYFSDSDVRECSSHREIDRRNWYLLFYERRDN